MLPDEPLANTSAARIPASALAGLGDLRRESGLLVREEGPIAWLFWSSPEPRLARRLLAVPGAVLYENRRGIWHRLGHHLPDFEADPDPFEARPLASILLPAPIVPVPPRGSPGPTALGLVRDESGDDRPAAAWLGPSVALARWAGSSQVPTARLTALRAATAGDLVLAVGPRPPEIFEGERFWGSRVLCPLGMTPAPRLPEAVLREAAGLEGEDILLLRPAGFEIVPAAAMRTLTRASARSAGGGEP